MKFVKGICWDPLNEFFASQSCDRTVKIYRVSPEMLSSKKNRTVVTPSVCFNLKSAKLSLNGGVPEEDEARNRPLFADDSLFAYFRRLCWSPDGSFLVTPTGTTYLSAVVAVSHAVRCCCRCPERRRRFQPDAELRLRLASSRFLKV